MAAHGRGKALKRCIFENIRLCGHGVDENLSVEDDSAIARSFSSQDFPAVAVSPHHV